MRYNSLKPESTRTSREIQGANKVLKKIISSHVNSFVLLIFFKNMFVFIQLYYVFVFTECEIENFISINMQTNTITFNEKQKHNNQVKNISFNKLVIGAIPIRKS